MLSTCHVHYRNAVPRPESADGQQQQRSTGSPDGGPDPGRGLYDTMPVFVVEVKDARPVGGVAGVSLLTLPCHTYSSHFTTLCHV